MSNLYSSEATKIPSLGGRLKEMLVGNDNSFPVEMFAGPLLAAGASKFSNVAIENLGNLTPNITTAQAPVIQQSVGQGTGRVLKK